MNYSRGICNNKAIIDLDPAKRNINVKSNKYYIKMAHTSNQPQRESYKIEEISSVQRKSCRLQSSLCMYYASVSMFLLVAKAMTLTPLSVFPS